ncbi:MAG: hypothetical protein GX564_01745 [Oligosphaeraceae bacterium]|nr:hypothetical protein [Oligosphaeraceae bacterium]
MSHINKNALAILFFIVASLLFSSCLVNDKLVGYDKHKKGLMIYGRMPAGLGFRFLPGSSSSHHHIFNSLRIEYKKIESDVLDNLNLYFLDNKLNLGAVNYDDVLAITPNLPHCEKIVQSHSYDWKKEKTAEISFYIRNQEQEFSEIRLCEGVSFFRGEQREQFAMLRFFFASDTKKIQELYLHLPFTMNLSLVKLENLDKSIAVPFPLHGEDVLLLFGENLIIQKDSSH